MDSGSLSSSAATIKSQLHFPFQEQFIQRKNSKENLDRFIPNRSTMDFDYSHYMLTEGAKGKENLVMSSPSKDAYRKQLAESLNMNQTKILAFKNKPLVSVDLIPHDINTFPLDKPTAKPRIFIPQSSKRTLHAPDLMDDYDLNFLDWGNANVLAIALGSIMYLWDAVNGSTSELVTVDNENGPIIFVSWAPDGRHFVIGLKNSEVQLWNMN
ncbi:hypothetical protein RJT34_02626 [Clitoria ternatea]|uniref:Anaphase-promoting complex subunit 4 WD40 domain-containing protein n=1 Tax=Clitoria ternatea TaxID=43366 RepID=A0AAN9KK79_CLITE